MGGCKFNIYNMALAIICCFEEKWNAKSVHNQVIWYNDSSFVVFGNKDDVSLKIGNYPCSFHLQQMTLIVFQSCFVTFVQIRFLFTCTLYMHRTDCLSLLNCFNIVDVGILNVYILTLTVTCSIYIIKVLILYWQ